MTDQSKLAEKYLHQLEVTAARVKKWYHTSGGKEKKREYGHKKDRLFKELLQFKANHERGAAVIVPEQQEARSPQQVVIRRRRQGVSYAVEEVVPPVVVAPKEVVIKRPKAKLTLEKVIEQLELPDIGFKTENSRIACINGIKGVFKITGCQYFDQCIKQFNKVKESVANAMKSNGEPYGTNAKKSFIYSVIWTQTHLNVPLPEDVKKQYKALLAVYSQQSSVITAGNKVEADKSVLSQSEYVEKIEYAFGVQSKEWLITHIYLQVPCRDDLSLTIVSTAAPTKKDTEKNYIIVPRGNGNCKIILNKYKTSVKYTDLKFDLDKSLSVLVRSWIEKNKIEMGSTLFREASLSSFVSKMNEKIGIKGGINYLRHMIISNQNVDSLTPEQLIEQATRAGHSAAVHMSYVRLISS